MPEEAYKSYGWSTNTANLRLLFIFRVCFQIQPKLSLIINVALIFGCSPRYTFKIIPFPHDTTLFVEYFCGWWSNSGALCILLKGPLQTQTVPSLVSVLSSAFFLRVTWCSENEQPQKAVRILDLLHTPTAWQQQKNLCIRHMHQAQWDSTSPCPGLTSFGPSPSIQSLPKSSLYFFFLSRDFPSTVSAGNHPPSCTRRGRKRSGRVSPKCYVRLYVCQMLE